MEHRLLVSLALASLTPSLVAQEDSSRSMRPIPGAVRDAGVYHAANGTWTRKASQAALGSDVVFDNDCSSGYYTAQDGDVFIDEGRIPSPTSPPTATTTPGCLFAYTIDGFQISYCSDSVTGASANIAFYANYTPCASVIGQTPAGGVFLPSLPGGGSTLACWILTIDLTSQPPSSSLAFVLPAGDDFGYALQFSPPPGSGLGTGPVIAGDPTTCPVGAGTVFYTGGPASGGTGIGSQDLFRIEGGAIMPGCYFFSGDPFASFHMRLYADACSAAPGSLGFCLGDGSGTACPCGNNAPVGSGGGCLNSVNRSGKIIAIGAPTLADDTLALLGSDMPPSSILVYCQGSLQSNGGNGTVFGDGLRCLAGTMVRLGLKQNQNGGSRYPGPSDPSVSVGGMVTAPGTLHYQAWHRDPATFCTSATHNLTNGVSVAWGL